MKNLSSQKKLIARAALRSNHAISQQSRDFAEHALTCDA
jgi:hypothetical protein